VSERPNCLAASSHSAFDVTLSQVDPLVTMMYAPASVVVSTMGVVVDGPMLLVEVDGSSSPKVHPGCPVTQLGQGVKVREGHEVNRRQ